MYKKTNNAFYGSLVMNEKKHSKFMVKPFDKVLRYLRNNTFQKITLETDNYALLQIDNDIELKRVRFYGVHILDFAKLQFFMIYHLFFIVYFHLSFINIKFHSRFIISM